VRSKVCLIGDPGVGKTSLVRRFVFGEYSDAYNPTLGAKVSKKELSVRTAQREVRVSLIVWDIMGEPDFREALADTYFRGGRGLIGVGDLTRPGTVQALRDWIKTARRFTPHGPIVLLGNKSDLVPHSGASEMLAEIGASYKAPSWRTSAKTGENVEAAFASLAKMIAGPLPDVAAPNERSGVDGRSR